jgi:hypothetical protein
MKIKENKIVEKTISKTMACGKKLFPIPTTICGQQKCEIII